MVKLTTRLSAAYNAFRSMRGSAKGLPFAWPIMEQGQPQWHLIDIESYIREGYQMNSLVYSAIMFKVRSMMVAPLLAYTGTEEDPKKLPKGNELVDLLRRQNKYQSWAELQSRNTVFLNLTGNVYVWFDFMTGEMYSLNPQRVYIITNKGMPAEIKGFVYVPPGKSP